MTEQLGAVGLISGGLDSTVVAAYMANTFDKNYFMFANYGQKTLSRELQSFNSLCDHFKPEAATVVDLTWMRAIGHSALFEEETRLNEENRKREYVPFRNANLLSAAVALAETVEAGHVLIGSVGTDRTCPDNSVAFLRAFQGVVNEGTMTDKQIQVIAPLINLDKKGAIELGIALGAPFELSWSCHNNSGDIACGGCSNCTARIQGFAELGLTDPTPYELDA